MRRARAIRVHDSRVPSPWRAGTWGADCSLSFDSSGRVTLLAGTGYRPGARRPLVYVYEMPPRFNVWWAPAQDHRSAEGCSLLYTQAAAAATTAVVAAASNAQPAQANQLGAPAGGTHTTWTARTTTCSGSGC
jgi:hypothetical protein